MVLETFIHSPAKKLVTSGIPVNLGIDYPKTPKPLMFHVSVINK